MTIGDKEILGLDAAYSLVTEKAKDSGTVDTTMKVGQSFDKSQDKAKGEGTDSPSAKAVKKPVEKKYETSEKSVKEDKENDMAKIPNTFDELFKKTLVEEDMTETSPLEQGGENEFNDDEGDFPPVEGSDEDLQDNVDVATKLRLIIDDLQGILDSMGGGEEGDEHEEGETPEAEAGEEMNAGEIAPDGVRMEGYKPMKNTVSKMTSKGNIKVKSNLNPAGGKAKCGCGNKDTSGNLKPAKKTSFGPNMAQKASASGPSATPKAKMF